MGQKVHPMGIRLGIIRDWSSRWFAKGAEYKRNVLMDINIRKYLKKKLATAALSTIVIERTGNNVVITLSSARPGVIIGKKGEDVEFLKKQVAKITHAPVHIAIDEIRKPELDATLVAESVAQQLERRIMFRRAMKRAVSNAMRQGAKGIKIMVAGRLGGAEIARSEWYREGRVPLHTLRADVDYGTAEAKTTYGIIGVKVWIFKGEIFRSELSDDKGATGAKEAEKEVA